MIDTFNSELSTRPLTSAEKVDLLSEQILWSLIPGCTRYVDCTSPASGNTYRVGADGSCSCPAGKAGRACWHLKSLLVDYPTVADAVADLTSSVRVIEAVAVAAPVVERVRPVISAKTYAADWN